MIDFDKLNETERQRWILHAEEKCKNIIDPNTFRSIDPQKYAKYLWEMYEREIKITK